MNGFIHGSQGLQTRPNQAEFKGNGPISDRHNMMMRGIGNIETQQSNALDYNNSGFAVNSERGEVADSPINYDFLGGQQQFTRNPNTGQPHSRQQPGYNEVQFLQQQLLYRQLQEMQRQQQVQQLGQGGRQPNQFNHLLGSEKAFPGVQLPPVLSGMPLQNASNRIWSNELGVDAKVANNPQFLVAGNINWLQNGSSVQGFPNGLMFSNEHGQVMRSTGVSPQQSDQNLYGTPVHNSKGSLNYAQFQGISYDCNDIVPKAVGGVAEQVKISDFQNDGHSMTGVGTGNLQQENYFSQGVQAQDMHGKLRQANWSDHLQQKLEASGGARGVTNLDSTEEKLLFSADNNGSWNSHLGIGGHLHGNPLERDNPSGFPSVQSGSWSALMQEALGASGSDIGVQEEWGGLSFSQKEQLNDSQPAELDNNVQAVSSLNSRPFPFLSDADKGSTHLNAQNFQGASTTFMSKQDEKLTSDGSHESFQQFAHKKHLDLTVWQNHSVGSGLPPQMHFGNVPGGAWPANMPRQSINSNVEPEFNVQRMQGIWHQQQKVPLQRSADHSGSKGNSLNINETFSPSREVLQKVHGVDARTQYVHGNDLQRASQTESGSRPAVKNSNAQNVNLHMTAMFQDDFGKHGSSNTPMNVKGDDEPNKNTQVFGSTLNLAGKASGKYYDNRQKKNIELFHKFSHTSQLIDGGTGAAENSMSITNEANPLTGRQDSTVQSGHRTPGPSRFHYQPKGVAFNAESANSQNRELNSQVSPQFFVPGWKYQDQGYIRHPQLSAHLAHDIIDEKNHSTELQKNAEGQRLQFVYSSHDGATVASFDGSTPQHQHVCQGSQNMLELLHKVDQTSDNSTSTQHNNSDRSSLPLTSEVDRSDEGISSHSSRLQGFALGLAPPTPSHSGAGAREQTLFRPPANVACQGGTNRGSIQTNIQADSSLVESALPYASQNFPQQPNNPSPPVLTARSPSANFSGGFPVDSKELLKHTACLGQTLDSNVEAVGDQSEQTSLAASRVFPSRPTSGPPNRAAVATRFYPFNRGLPQSLHPNAATNLRKGDQQTSVLPCLPQQGGLSSMLQNMWTNVSAQHPSVIHAQKTAPNLVHPLNQLSNSRGATSLIAMKEDDQKVRNKLNTLPESINDLSSAQNALNLEESKIESGQQSLLPDKADIASRMGIAYQAQQTLLKRVSDGNSPISVPSMVRLHQHELSKGKHVLDSLVGSQVEHAPLSDVINPHHGVGTSGIDLETSNIRNQNYSLLRQMQAMKSVESEFGLRADKRPISELDSEATQMDWRSGQEYSYGQNTVLRHPPEGKLVTTQQQNSLPSSIQMLSFTSKEYEGNSANLSDPKERVEDVLASVSNDLGNENHSLCSTPMLTTVGGNEQIRISPQMAPTWFKQYGSYKNGQILAVCDNTSLQGLKDASEETLIGISSERRIDCSAAAQRDEASKAGDAWGSSAAIVAAVSHSPSSNTMSIIVPQRPNKRKSLTSDFIPWHKEVAEGSKQLWDISVAAREWASATNRIVEKVEDEFDTLDEGSLLVRPKRRLVLTTVLVQQLLTAVPAHFLREKTSTSYESVTYFVAKSALGDACSLVCHASTDSSMQSDEKTTKHKRINTSENVRKQIFLKVSENFIRRSRNLDTDLVRLDKRVSMLDLKMECQDLERCSIINRFAKFHGRPQNDGTDGSEMFPRRIYPQRQVIMLPMPRNVPVGAFCLSL